MERELGEVKQRAVDLLEEKEQELRAAHVKPHSLPLEEYTDFPVCLAWPVCHCHSLGEQALKLCHHCGAWLPTILAGQNC
jgi:hypothetical protein